MVYSSSLKDETFLYLMKFTKRTDYALRVMEALAKLGTGNSIPVKDLCSKGMALKFLQSVVSDLSRAGLIIAKSGPKGGIELAREPFLITVLDIIEAAEGPLNIMQCLDHPQSCSGHCECSIMKILFNAQDAFKERLKNSSLQLMVQARIDPFNRVPEGHFQKPAHPCPVIKTSAEKSKIFL